MIHSFDAELITSYDDGPLICMFLPPSLIVSKHHRPLCGPRLFSAGVPPGAFRLFPFPMGFVAVTVFAAAFAQLGRADNDVELNLIPPGKVDHSFR